MPEYTEPKDRQAARLAFHAAKESFKQHKDRILLVKFGGSLAEKPEHAQNIVDQSAYLHEAHQQRVVLFNGGKGVIDAEISRMKQLGEIQSDSGSGEFDVKTGFRDTDLPTLKAADRALRELNGSLVRRFNALGYKVKAQGMAGYDRDLIKALPLEGLPGGYTGVIEGAESVDRKYLFELMATNTVPIIYPICTNASPRNDETRLNVNGDVVAAGIGQALEDPSHPGRVRMIMCTDTPGVFDKEKKLIPTIYVEDVPRLIEDGTVQGGMIAKLTAARDAANVIHGGVVILDGSLPGAIISEVTTEGGNGTLVIRRPTSPGLRPG